MMSQDTMWCMFNSVSPKDSVRTKKSWMDKLLAAMVQARYSMTTSASPMTSRRTILSGLHLWQHPLHLPITQRSSSRTDIVVEYQGRVVLRLDFLGTGVEEMRVIDLHDRVLFGLSPNRGHDVQERYTMRSQVALPQVVWLADANEWHAGLPFSVA